MTLFVPSQVTPCAVRFSLLKFLDLTFLDMVCLHYKLVKNKVTGDWFEVPCGQCRACKVNKAVDWSVRCMLESGYYKEEDCCFLTLTQRDDMVRFVGDKPTLFRKDLQDFVKRLRIAGDRQQCKKLKCFYACGEYGSKRGRPHYHMLCFGYCPSDLVFFKYSYSGFPIFKSASLENLWGRGLCFVGRGVSQASSAYVARYVSKKLKKSEYEEGVVPEFSLSSRNILVDLSNGEVAEVAIGGRWCLDNIPTVVRGFVNDRKNPNLKHRIPRYFEKILEKYGHLDEVAQMKKYRRDMADKKCRERVDAVTNLNDEEYWKRCDNLYHAIKQLEEYQTSRLSTLKRNFEEE